jgi:hypothetical protein
MTAALPLTVALSGCTPSAKATTRAFGTYVPSVSTTGVPLGTSLKTVWGDITITKPGTVLDSLDIHGFVKVRAASVTIRRSIIRGSGPGHTDTGLVDVNSAAANHVLIEDCDLTHGFPSVWVDGVIGHDYTALRNNVHNVVDGFGVYNANNKSADLNVTIEGNYVHDLNYMAPDPETSDNHTHNDGVQIQGTGPTHGKLQVKIFGNNIQAFVGPGSNTRSPWYPTVSGQAIAVTPNVTQVHDVLMDHNELNGGRQSVTLIPGPKGTGSGLTLSNNRFGRGQVYMPVRITAPVKLAMSNNLYDDGKPITVGH